MGINNQFLITEFSLNCQEAAKADFGEPLH
jgi:hypothetical protein